MYKSIIFDLGGVMVDFDPKAYLVDRLCNAAIEEQVYDLTFGSEEWKQLDAGLVSRFDGNQAMLRNAKAAGCEFEVQGVLDDWLHILRPRHRMEELVRRQPKDDHFGFERTAYLLLFEVWPRYLFVFAPLYVLLAAMALDRPLFARGGEKRQKA